MPLENLQDLEQEWAEFMYDRPGGRSGWSQDQKWRADNPGKLSHLIGYRNGGPRPDFSTSKQGATERRMLEHLDAWHKAKADDPPPPPADYGIRESYRGPLTPIAGDNVLRDGDGLLTEKRHVSTATGYGIANMRWPYQGPSTGLWTVRDCLVEDVSADPPKSMDGTGEAGFWIGEKALVERVEARACAWMGMWTGAASSGSRFYDVDLRDNPHVGLYLEHVSSDFEFHHCSFGGKNTGSSINAEWWYRDGYGQYLPYGGRSGSFNVGFYDCEIYCPPSDRNARWDWYTTAGAFLDAGTFGFRFERCRFFGPGLALGLPSNRLMVDSSKPNVYFDCVFDNLGGTVHYYDDRVIG